LAYSCYIVSSGPVANTLMGGGTPGAGRQFVSVSSGLLPYNSRLPVVAYAPEDMEMSYRIWSAGAEKEFDQVAQDAAIKKAGGTMQAYSAADKGMVRRVMQLPSVQDESSLRVELVAGRTIETDGVNHYSLDGGIEENMITGWQFPRYDVTLGGVTSTKMGVLGKHLKVNKFVAIGGRPQLFRYNSRLPLVVYLPEDGTVRYRIWRAAQETKAMPATAAGTAQKKETSVPAQNNPIVEAARTPACEKVQGAVQSWIDGIKGKAYKADLRSNDGVSPLPSKAINSSLFALQEDNLYIGIGFSKPPKIDTSLTDLQATFAHIALDRLPVPGIKAVNWETRLQTPVSSFKDGVTLESWKDGVLRVRVQTEFFAAGGHRTDIIVPADAPMQKGTYFQIRTPIKADLLIEGRLLPADEKPDAK
jgi:ecotin